jgi:uncharacterized protein (DUF169 family)
MYELIAEDLKTSLRLHYPAVGVAFSNNGPDVPMYSGSAPAGCSFWEEAFTKPIKTSAADHQSCSIGIYTHNLAGAPSGYEQQLGTVLKVLGDLQYVQPSDLSLIPVLKEQPRYVLYGPLREASTIPHVVLMFADSRQGLIITEAAQQVDGVIPPVLGRPACAVIPQVVNSGKAAMSLGCCGARAYLPAMSDSTALWALPGAKISDYAARINALARANDLLAGFHRLRAQDVKSGARPTYEESLERFSKG